MTTIVNPTIVMAIMAAAGSLGLLAVAFLITFLVQHELLNGAEDARARRAAESLIVVIVPLLVVFGFIITFRMIDLWH
jgi:NADH:ubiquinone oxidoreductase subunit 5 (subunit L)/multisubunit Na+/H+ antiporter MnhA subunit